MSNFQKDDRVVVINTEHRNQHGKVAETIYGLIERKYLVKLDNNSNLEIPERFLEYENLKPSEVSEQIKNVKNQVDKVASQLSEEMVKELPTHLKYLEDAITSKDKERADREYDYVEKNLKAVSQKGFVTMETIKISLEKLHWAWKHVS